MPSSTSAKKKDPDDESVDEYKERFSRLFKEDNDHDCEFIVGPQKSVIKGHKLLFSVASDVFHAMFYSQLKENSTIVIDDLDIEGFQGMKHFIYTGSVSFSSTIQACFTYVAARKYIIPQLMDKSIGFALKQNITPSEVLDLYEFCKCNNISEMEEKCIQIIQEETEEVVKSKYFLLVDFNTIDAILRLNSLHLESELEIFKHLERWVIADADRRNLSKDKIASTFNCLTKHIRFLTMNCEEFASGPGKSPLLTQEEKLAIGLNLMDFGSTTYPENFSLVQQERLFKSPSYCEVNIKETFLVSIDEAKKNKVLKTFNFGDDKWILFQRFFKDKSIYFHVQPENVENTSLIHSRIKLRVKARMKFDDLCFENESFIIYNEESKSESNDKFGISSPVIPLEKLKRSRYMANNAVVIEGSFFLEDVA